MQRNFETFSSLWGQYHSDLYRYIYSHVNNSFDSEDILQTTALKAANSFYQLKDIKKAKTWFFTIASNSIRDYYRRKKEVLSIEELPEPLSKIGDEKESYVDLRLSFNKYMKRLPVQKQNLMCLYMQNDFSIKEMASILDIGYSTARKWLDEIRGYLYDELFVK